MSFELSYFKFLILEKHLAITNLPIGYTIIRDIRNGDIAYINVKSIDKYNVTEFKKVREYIVDKFNADHIESYNSDLNNYISFSCNSKDVFKVLRESGII